MLPAPIIAFSPIVTPGRIVELAPMLAPFFIVVMGNESGYFFDLGNGSFVNVTLGPMKTSSSTLKPSQSWTPLFIVTLLPTITLFSINTPAHKLQFLPITASGNTTQNCHMLVPSPTAIDLTSASGCIIVVREFHYYSNMGMSRYVFQRYSLPYIADCQRIQYWGMSV